MGLDAFGACYRCPYPKQCSELTELGLPPSSGFRFNQNYYKDKKKITYILGIST